MWGRSSSAQFEVSITPPGSAERFWGAFGKNTPICASFPPCIHEHRESLWDLTFKESLLDSLLVKHWDQSERETGEPLLEVPRVHRAGLLG